MIDFVEYVVAELASKRLTKPEAISLIKQFQSRPRSGAGPASIHPLLHANLSDLYQQTYSARLDGSEFFLRDHVVNGDKVLPGVAYLEMARAAIDAALAPEEGAAVELRDIVWIQPIVVAGVTDVSITLLPEDDGRIGFEISSIAAGQETETVHARGVARIVAVPAGRSCDLAALAAPMQRGRLDAPLFYDTYAALGISYGPAHRAVSTILQGEGQLLAYLTLPDSAEEGYLLHPSVLDGAVQAALGLAADLDQLDGQLRLPFALDTLRIHAPCAGAMVAWLRYAPGFSAGDSVVKLDIDLCDSAGRVCAELHGFTARALPRRAEPARDTVATLYATPAWETRPAAAGVPAFRQRHIVVAGLPAVDWAELALLTGSRCLRSPASAASADARYHDTALHLFESIKAILADKPQEALLLQLAVPRGTELTGLSGLLKSASLENPLLATQLVEVDPAAGTAQLAASLQQEACSPHDAVVRSDAQGQRQVLILRELTAPPQAASAWRADGVYLITGGLGGLGQLFARDILTCAGRARVVLTGRAAPSAASQASVDALGARAAYRQLDLADADAVKAAVSAIVAEHGRLDGILHAAGMLADGFILKKDSAQFAAVLAPKVTGTVHLVDALRGLDVEFMVLFSGGAALTGNVGQSDYACANGFLDHYAATCGTVGRNGRIRAINWPLWEEGGMGTDAVLRTQLKERFGMHPLDSRTGLDALHLSLALPDLQLQVVQGDALKLRRALFDTRPPAPAPVLPAVAPQAPAASQAQDVLKRQLAHVLRLPAERIDAAAPFEKYGIDSIMMMELTQALEKTFGPLPKTLFFEYHSLAELTRYFVKTYPQQFAEQAVPVVAPPPVPLPVPQVPQAPRRRRQLGAPAPAPSQVKAGPIAIVGLSGRYPGAPDLATFWTNLRDGKDCVTEVPKSRWDWEQYYTDDRTLPGRHYSKWGGFIEGVDEFDPLFFNISPREASMVDPQERLFLQHAWMAVEDAGYTRGSLQVARDEGLAGMVGVYVGVMYGEYNLSGSLASIANRVSYVLNVHGPSMTLDTMCSSSLTAIHLACQDLKQGRTDVGIAGGVNVSIHPSKYLLLSAGQFISGAGHCQSFGEGGDGYIPGEGVGAVVLKRLEDAERDGDHIYGIIKGSAINHGGKVNGYTVPNPHAQSAVIAQALREAGADGRQVSYVEAHGTGTKLGDPIEILALTQAFQKDGAAIVAGACAIGSVKSNIGHGESAAGIAGLTKILLQMKHGQIVPSLHSARLNPNIDFGATPFTVNQTLRTWEAPRVDGRSLPRLAGMSSFGAGGSNAHLVIEEYVAAAAPRAAGGQYIVPLSARTPDQLRRKAEDLLGFVRSAGSELASLAYTLQIGREPMDERLGFVCASLDQLADQLQAWLAGAADGASQYSARRNDESLALFGDDADLQDTVAKWIGRRNLPKLLALWVRGVEIPWAALHEQPLPPRCSLPAYPFARDKYWIESVGQVVKDAVAQAARPVAVLHPLLHRNTSSLGLHSYSTQLDPGQWFVGAGQQMLWLEMARAALHNAAGGASVTLRELAWGQPAVAGRALHIALAPDAAGQVEFDIYSESDQVHCQGVATVGQPASLPSVDIAQLRQRMTPAGLALPNVLASHAGGGEYLLQLSLPAEREEEQGAWLLHPAAMPALLRTAAALSGAAAQPASLAEARLLSACPRDALAWVRSHGDTVDIDLFDAHGTVCVQLRGLALMRAAAAPLRTLVLATEVETPAPFVAAALARTAIRLLDADDTAASLAPAARAPVRLALEVTAPVALAAPAPVPVVGITQQALREQLTESLAACLYMSAQDIDTAKPFVELGLDSIVGVEWVKAINKQFGLNLSATRVYDYPTITQLAALVAEELGEGDTTVAAPAPVVAPAPVSQAAPANLAQTLTNSLAEALYMDAADIDPAKPFVELGLDSIVGVEWVKAINKALGINLSATKVYDYPTIDALAAMLVAEGGVAPTSAPVAVAAPVAVLAPAPMPAAALAHRLLQRRTGAARKPSAPAPAARPAASEKIAIVGMSGRYPQAKNLHQFWDNLAEGRNAIVEIPPSRWDVAQYFDPDPQAKGKIYCKWLGMLDDADCFDPLFFQISPAEAESMDPQHRLFMQEAYRAFEDAGYSNSALSNTMCGVYLGIMNNEYSLLLARAGSASVDATGTSYAIGAARIAYHLNLKGPAIPIDTACSSSLVGIHLACQALLSGEIDMALAGGSTLYLTPDSYLGMCQAGMLSPDGQCKTFDNGANGFVPGEGAGAVVLKRLSDAEADGDHIHGVILGSAINQDGKTNGITAPSVNSQIALERQLYARCGIDPASISYVETHGTGTKLGDPIELEALGTVYGEQTAHKNYCALGSVKSNIGHTSAAAGVASVQKVLLSMRHRTLAPTLNVGKENSLFDFADSPFYICRERTAWRGATAAPLRAAVSSFGFSGTNAHLVLEEYVPVAQALGVAAAHAVLLSARTAAQLEQKARDLLAFLQDEGKDMADLASLAWTLQTGREAFRERLACVAGTGAELAEQLRSFVDGIDDVPGLARGHALRDKAAAASADPATVGQWLAQARLRELAQAWTRGIDIDWTRLYADKSRPRRMSLPTYPFALERYWVANAQPVAPAAVAAPRAGRETVLYAPSWQAAETPPQGAAVDGPVLVIGTGAIPAGAVAALPGSQFVELSPNTFMLDFSCEAEFDRLVQVLAERALLPRAVIHHTGASQDPHQGVMALFSLCKALMATLHGSSLRLLSLVDGSPAQSAIGAFYRTLQLENPHVSGRAVEIRSAGPLDPGEQQALIAAELAAVDKDVADVRYDAGAQGWTRAVRTLARVPAAIPKGELPLKQGGVYLVTGGLGGLGLIVARYLSETYQARIALVGRSACEAVPVPGAIYLQADVARLDDMQRAVEQVRARFGQLNGVFHSAGVNRDAFLIRKSREDMQAVLSPKLLGAANLDAACAGQELDLFVLFSSIAGVLGNPGQCDYAYANRFLDDFAAQRQARRPGRSLSIAWPLWLDGGMSIPAEEVERRERELGVSPLPTAEGIACLEQLLRSGLANAVPLYGYAERIELLTAPPLTEVAAAPKPEQGQISIDAAQDYLKRLIGAEIKLAPDLIDADERFDSFGIDSIVVGRLNATLAQDLGSLPKTLFYEYQSIAELAGYLAGHVAQAGLAASVAPAQEPAPDMPAAAAPAAPAAAQEPVDKEPIAIIGMHGIFPHSADLDQFWENLRSGADMVGPVPRERWDAEAWFDADPAQAANGKIYCKTGGFIEDAAAFDASFFNLPAEEAKLIDPQERLFLQSVWSSFEDAGYTRQTLRQRHPKAKSADVGVFVGVTTSSYQMLQADEWARGHVVAPSAMPWSIANRVSYYFDLQGPSMPVDTACSSSLVAIHLACDSLRRGECQVAVAGGVNLYAHPSRFHSFCQRGMLAAEGRCRSYGAGDDGFVPAEVVASLILKPLSRAIADGDQIHAVIAGSAVEHGGRSNGYAAPNPHSQASVIGAALADAGFGADTIGYVEGHGTGTQLGDNLEVTALSQAFRSQGGSTTSKRQYCPLGSSKANFGHAESAAGIAGVAKVVLQMKHRQLAPTLHAAEPNPNIDFAASPFYLQHALADWVPAADGPRRALVNSFGAGGVNACVALEEYVAPAIEPADRQPHMVVLSAKDDAALARKIEQLIALLGAAPATDLASLAWTLQTAREAMPERLALVVADAADLAAKLRQASSGETGEGIWRGAPDPRKAKKAARIRGAFNPLYAARDLAALCEHWVGGAEIDWARLAGEAQPHLQRISLPTYPFAKERHWASEVPAGLPLAAPHAGPQALGGLQAGLHPLISYNSSTLAEVTFSSWLSADEFYARDHRVNGVPMFPGAGYLEIACVAGALAGGRKVASLRDVVWIAPLSFGAGAQLVQIALQTAQDSVSYMVTSFDECDEKQVHSEGILVFADGEQDTPAPLDLPALRAQCTDKLDPALYYQLFEQSGIGYGPAFRTMQALAVGPQHAMATLALSPQLRDGFDEFVLHPSIVDGALQAVAALVGRGQGQGQGQGAAPFLPFAIDEVTIVRPLAPTCHVLVEHAAAGAAPAAGGDIMRFNVTIVNSAGQVLVRMRDFCVRALAPQGTADPAQADAVK